MHATSLSVVYVVAVFSAIVVESAPAMTFKTLLRRLQKPYGSVKAFAKALGLGDPSRISRGSPFDVRGCLNLARVTSENPSVILRAAGKSDIADLIERLYGAPKARLSQEEETLLEALDGVRDPARRRLVLDVVRAIANHPPGTSGAEGGTSGEGPGGNGPSGGPPGEGLIHHPAVVYPRRARG